MVTALLYYALSILLGFFSPVLGLTGLACSLLIRFQDRVPEIAAFRPFTLLLAGMLLSCLLHSAKLSKHRWKQDKLLIAMLIVSILGLLVLEPGDVISETIQFVSSLAMFYFASRLMTKQWHFYFIFFAMAGCVLFLGYEAYQSIQANPLTTIHFDPRTVEMDEQGNITGRWQGIGYYANANEFGALMIFTIPFLLAWILARKNLIVSLAAVAAMCFMIYVVGKSGSRTVMVLLGFIFVATFVLRSRGKLVKKSIVAGIMGLLLLVVLSYIPGPIQDRLNSILEAGTDSSFQGRTRAWGYGFQMLSWYPITGVGKGQWYEYHGLAAHNSYVNIMAELGPAGIYLFIWILVLGYKELMPFVIVSDKDPPFELDNATRTLAIAVFVSYSTWLIYIFLGNHSYAFWTYFYIGLCAAMRNLRPEIVAEEKPGTSLSTEVR